MNIAQIEKMLTVVKTIYSFMTMTEQDFTFRMKNDKENYKSEVGVVANYIKDFVLRGLKELGKGKTGVEQKRLNNIEGFLQDGKLFKEFFVLLHSVKYRAITRGYMFDSINAVIDWLTSSCDPELIKKFKRLRGALIGVDFESHKRMSRRTRVSEMLSALLQIFFKDLEPSFELILKLVNLSFALQQSSHNRMEMVNKLQEFSEEIGCLFGVNPQEIHGIMGIIHGDYQALVKMCAPIAKIEPAVIFVLFLSFSRL